ncbi:MAG: PKD domain-containing protein, partial [Methanoculleus sp.]|nr:PKD domain-containing protein [Methanoculleus sp.]
NPSHTYTTPGTYTVALQAYNDDGYNATRQIGYITVTAAPVAPTANFTGTPTSGTVPLAVQFNDTSAGSPIVWNWSFGDGAWHNTTDAAERNATHTYAAAGTYTVSLMASNAVGSDTHTETNYITVSAAPVPPVANFTANRTSGTVPLAVQFNDTSTDSPTGWNWSFGDSAWHNTTDAAERNATHTYAAAGTYTVSLTVDNADGTDTHTETGYITVTDPTPTVTPTSRPVYSGGGGGGSTGGPGGYNVGGDSAVSTVNVTGTGLKTFIVTGREQSSPGAGIPPAPGTPYQYVDLVPARFTEITGANITFTVPVAWLDEHGFTPEEIVMYHYNGTAWEALPTWVVDAAGTTVTFTATSPGFSLFAITGIEQPGEAVTTPTAAATTSRATAEPTAEQTTAAPAGGVAPDFPLGTVALVAGAVLVLAAGGYLVWRRGVHR